MVFTTDFSFVKYEPLKFSEVFLYMKALDSVNFIWCMILCLGAAAKPPPLNKESKNIADRNSRF
ncbi:hypothetical protein ASG01_08670 [Chryseobacterium sp. Leaf180]|nr:hypothetical protein ASG01_08670 [Chryseobacterium sp. Leaf180]